MLVKKNGIKLEEPSEVTVKNCVVYNYQSNNFFNELLEYLDMKFEGDFNYGYIQNDLHNFIGDFFWEKDKEAKSFWQRVKEWFR